MFVLYLNGSYIGVEKSFSKSTVQVNDGTIIRAVSEGIPFRGKPEEMANDVMRHLFKRSANRCLFPVVVESTSGTDKQGYYTSEVAFQAACHFLY